MGTEWGFSKLRAGGFCVDETTDLAASLLRCAAAPSFFAPAFVTAGVLVWGALEVIGYRNKNRSIYSTFNLPKQIQLKRWPEGQFWQIRRKRLDCGKERRLAAALLRQSLRLSCSLPLDLPARKIVLLMSVSVGIPSRLAAYKRAILM